MNTEFNGFAISDDIHRVDFRRVTGWLAGSYWSPGITCEEVKKGALNSSLVIGAYASGSEQVGYGRLVSDRTRFAYIMDVFVDPAHRHKGLAGEMVRFAMAHPEHLDVYQWLLATNDAHRVYERLGFKPLTHPERWMMIRKDKQRSL